MKVWIINPYGNLPGENWSPYRSTSIANALTARGHEVVWWVSDFEHRSKTQRKCGTVEYGGGFSAKILRSSTYARHISWARVKYERNYARSLIRSVAASSERPDIIIHGEPAVCFSDLSLKVVRLCGCPLVIDVIDLWPELFEIALPRRFRWLAHSFLPPLYAKRRRFFRKANGFLAVSKNYLDLAQRLAPGKPGAVAYLGTDLKAYSLEVQQSIILPEKNAGEIWCIYVGTLGKNYDIPALLEASEQLGRHKVKIFVAGDGDLKAEVEAVASRNQLTYLGRQSFEQLVAIYPRFDIALACYAPGSTVSMPFKAFDYLAAGLPLVTSLAGDLGMFVQTQGIGTSYLSGNSDSLAQAVIDLACDAGRRELAGAASRRLGAKMDYSKQYSIAANLIEEVYAKRPIGNRL